MPDGPANRAQAAIEHASGGFVRPDVCAKAQIFVADYLRSDVEVYSQGVSNPTPCRKIKTGVSNPEGIYIDAKGTLYVGNYTGSTVTEYPHAGKVPAITITTSAPPYDVFVGVDRTLYVAEPTMDQVAEYPLGATTPSLTLAINGGAYGMATDNQNNLYVSYLSNSDGVSHVEEFAPGATTGNDLGFTVSFAGELKLDKHNDIIIGDRNNDVIDIFPPGATTPSRTIPTAGRPVYFCLNRTETMLYVSGPYQVQIFDYQSGTQVGSIASGLGDPSGTAARLPAPY
ncbi:MAG: hypothetical protein JO104_09565 [Candidatus Eremiobacteraeota bacterium]|nr:hypothetical protein [Candidatus Eremiobacteraeota bacterium]